MKVFEALHDSLHALDIDALPEGTADTIEELHDLLEADADGTGLEKQGRVLSGRNEALRNVQKVLEQARELVAEVLSQMKAPEPDKRPQIKRGPNGEISLWAPIIKIDAARRTVTAHVLAANVIDLQNDFITPDEIGKAQESFMLGFQNVGVMHQEVNPMLKVVESWQSPVSYMQDDSPVAKGDWLATLKIGDDEIWQRIVDGEFTGFSIGGVGKRIPVDVVPASVKTLEESLAASFPASN